MFANVRVMHDKRIRKVVIAGGGTSGWMAAATLAKQFGPTLDIALVESEDVGTIGVGEATIPPIKDFHHTLKIRDREREFMRAARATFKLGISFEDWRGLGKNYMHVFGWAGKGNWAAGFQHFWLRGRKLGMAGEFAEYCNESVAAPQNRFGLKLSKGLGYAYHIDATRYAAFLRGIAEENGVVRREGLIEQVVQDPGSGFITGLRLQSGQFVEGDLFIDCTGFRGLLIERTLKAGLEDFSHWLPCDRAIAVQTESGEPPHPYTRCIAREAGWQWRIPLQHRVGNGIVYSSRHWSDDEARARLLDNVQGATLTEPRVIRFQAGQRRSHWLKNCVAVGLAAGFIEPLESTSIHLAQQSIVRLVQLFPGDGIREPDIAEFNNQMRFEIDNILDFIVLHYHVTERTDTPFWRHCRAMEIPDSLRHRIELFRQSGRIFRNLPELFTETSWLQVMLGQGLAPERYHPAADVMSEKELGRFLDGIRGGVGKFVEQFPDHQRFIDGYCKAPMD